MMNKNDVRQYLELSIELATEGANLAKSLMGKTRSTYKKDKSIVTEADHRVQDLIVRKLTQLAPDHGLIAEETTELTSGRPGGNAEYVWVVDPIDGTRNFALGVKNFCCSVALLHRGSPIAGAIYEPNYDWLFSASADGSAEFNRQPTTVTSGRFNPDTIFGISVNTYAGRPPILHYLMDKCILRNFGSTALHLGMTGAGLLDGAIHFGGKLWDIAAGALILQRAGGEILPIDSKGGIIKRPFWPLDLKKYRNGPLPFIAGNVQLMDDLQNCDIKK